MRILLLCHYFAPEPGAPQARLLETGRAFVGLGHEVTVLTGFPNHPAGVMDPEDRGRVFRCDRIDGITVLRSWLHAAPNRGLGRKTLGHLSFMATSVLVGGARARPPDVVVASSPTFFSAISGFVLARRFGVPFVFEVRDLWPAIFVELGVMKSRLAIGLLERIEMFLYRRAARVVTVTEGFRRDIVGRGIPAERVVTITNGVDTERFFPRGGAEEAKSALGLAGRFVVLYLGAHGVSHALHRVLEAAALLRDDPGFAFVFVGDGAEKPALVRRAQELGLNNAYFLPPVGKDRVPLCYRAADVGLVPLRDVPLFSTFIPSKMFELLASGVPVLASLRGEAAGILAQSGGAEIVAPEDVDASVAALRRLRSDGARRAHMGRLGAQFARARYDRRVLARRYADVLASAVREGRP